MTVRNFALFMGIVFVAVGIFGFIPGITQMHEEHEGLVVHGPGHGMLLGLFHVNLLHNLVHIVFGVMGLAMCRTVASARLYAQIVAVGYGLLVILGLIPATNTVFGLVPIEGHDVWLHLLIAAAAAYFGFMAPESRSSGMTT